MKVSCNFIDDDRIKSIPYPPEIRADSINYGFKDLKSNPSWIEEVVEAKELPGLIALLAYFSDKKSPYFSVGCEKATWQGENGKYNTRGYFEFAFNYWKLAHRQNYLSLFNRFQASFGREKLRGLSEIEWRVSPVTIIKISTTIQSCTIWTMISDQPSEKLALKHYDEAMFFHTEFFSETEVPHGSGESIY